jgi:hypothetical protein
MATPRLEPAHLSWMAAGTPFLHHCANVQRNRQPQQKSRCGNYLSLLLVNITRWAIIRYSRVPPATQTPAIAAWLDERRRCSRKRSFTTLPREGILLRIGCVQIRLCYFKPYVQLSPEVVP